MEVLGFRIEGLGFRVDGLGFRMKGTSLGKNLGRAELTLTLTQQKNGETRYRVAGWASINYPPCMIVRLSKLCSSRPSRGREGQ
jgi:hypothetical protein